MGADPQSTGAKGLCLLKANARSGGTDPSGLVPNRDRSSRGASTMSSQNPVTPSIDNPFERSDAQAEASPPEVRGPYDEAVSAGEELRARPRTAAGPIAIGRQHAKDRMTV